MNTNHHPSAGDGKQGAHAHAKSAALDIFKKSQRLPALSAALKKRGGVKLLPQPPHAFEVTDFYHL